MELFPLKEKLFNLFDKSLPSPSPNILCSILKDLSQQLVVSRLDFQRLQSEARIPRDEDFPYSESSKQDTLRKYKEFTIEIDSSVDIAALESWTSVLCHQIHILLLVARMSCSCSANSPCWKDDIYQVVENRCEMAGFPLFSGVSNEKSGSSDLSQVLALIELTEETLLEMILFNWSYLHPDHSWFAHLKSTVSPKLLDACCDEVVASRHSLPRISWMLQAAINAFYNRIISFIGKSIDRKRFEKLEGNQSRLDLIAFVITEDDRISTVLQELLLLVGLNVSPSPFLSLTLNIEGLLDRFASILTFELKKYLNQALISCRGPDIMPPWEVRVVDKSVYVGPLPELIFEIFQTFLGMATSPDSYPNSSQFSRLKLLNMNKVIIHSVLASYDLLREEFDQIFSNMAKIFVDGKFSAMEQDKMNEVILQNISVLCSIANDCDRLTTIHIPKLLKESVMALTVNDDGSDVWMASQTYLHDLNAHVSDLQLEIKRIAWTAVESLTRIIFTDLKDLYLNRFEEILNTPVDNFPIFTSILRTLEDYLTDLRSNLLPEYFRMLVLSCCHKVLHR